MKRIFRNQVTNTIWLDDTRFITIEAFKVSPSYGHPDTYEPLCKKETLLNEFFEADDFRYYSPAQDLRAKTIEESFKKRRPKTTEKSVCSHEFVEMDQHGPFHVDDYSPEVYKKIDKKESVKEIKEKLKKFDHLLPEEFNDFFSNVTDETADFFSLKLNLDNHKVTGDFGLLEEFYEWMIIERSVPYIFIVTIGIE